MTASSDSKAPDLPDAGASPAARATPTLRDDAAEAFYARAIGMLDQAGIPVLIGGTFAVSAYTGISRATKDLDVFCRPADRQRVLVHFQEAGYRIEIVDDRWLGKVFEGASFFDVIHAASNGGSAVSESWFEHARRMEVLGKTASVIAPTELVWSKMFIQLRHRYDGADIAHVILRAHDQINWQRLLAHMDQHWEVLFAQLLNFRWVYPAKRDLVPEWLFSELLGRLEEQRQLPPPSANVCRGRMFSAPDYQIDVREWGFVDIGETAESREAEGKNKR